MSDRPIAEAATYTTHKKLKRRTFIPTADFEPAIPEIKRLQAYVLDTIAAGLGTQGTSETNVFVSKSSLMTTIIF
jgi:hypothetical protein